MIWFPDLLRHKVALALLAVIVLAAMGAGAWLSRRWRLMVQHRRLARARRGGESAPELLADLGYASVETHASRSLEVLVDGEPRSTEVVADAVASKDGESYVFEVAPGGRAADPLHPETLRRLLECALAFGPCRAVLLDPEREAEYRVEFPSLASRPASAPPARPSVALWKWLLLALLVGMLAGIGIGVRLRAHLRAWTTSPGMSGHIASS